MGSNFERYQRELTAVLRTKDKGEILAFMKRYGGPTPSSDLSFWAAVHKMRLSLPAFTEQEREESRAWLRERGMMPKPAIPENLRLHMRVFAAKLAEAEASGLTGDEAGIAAAEEANKLYPLTDEDKEALRTAGRAREAI